MCEHGEEFMAEYMSSAYVVFGGGFSLSNDFILCTKQIDLYVFLK